MSEKKLLPLPETTTSGVVPLQEFVSEAVVVPPETPARVRRAEFGAGNGVGSRPLAGRAETAENVSGTDVNSD